jgi:hypothetical protein
MGWRPRFTLAEALDRSLAVEDAALAEVRAGAVPPPASQAVKGRGVTASRIR